eukprot:365171-Chlamydomonas_euryale.AAC.16
MASQATPVLVTCTSALSLSHAAYLRLAHKAVEIADGQVQRGPSQAAGVDDVGHPADSHTAHACVNRMPGQVSAAWAHRFLAFCLVPALRWRDQACRVDLIVGVGLLRQVPRQKAHLEKYRKRLQHASTRGGTSHLINSRTAARSAGSPFAALRRKSVAGLTVGGAASSSPHGDRSRSSQLRDSGEGGAPPQYACVSQLKSDTSVSHASCCACLLPGSRGSWIALAGERYELSFIGGGFLERSGTCCTVRAKARSDGRNARRNYFKVVTRTRQGMQRACDSSTVAGATNVLGMLEAMRAGRQPRAFQQGPRKQPVCSLSIAPADRPALLPNHAHLDRAGVSSGLKHGGCAFLRVGHRHWTAALRSRQKAKPPRRDVEIQPSQAVAVLPPSSYVIEGLDVGLF